ncbi:hypothetical protein P4V43_28165, partial [Brevibacillus fortis]|uniref:hypothetical protein n=1 Tax=Brevibacillus fortis TaxID=2126352 RepID=UPI002E1FD4A8|nr:hypothetical protein [Brevibacillus fortis]
ISWVTVHRQEVFFHFHQQKVEHPSIIRYNTHYDFDNYSQRDCGQAGESGLIHSADGGTTE